MKSHLIVQRRQCFWVGRARNWALLMSAERDCVVQQQWRPVHPVRLGFCVLNLTEFWLVTLDGYYSLIGADTTESVSVLLPRLDAYLPTPGSAAQFVECLLPTEPGPGWVSSSASDVIRASSSHGFLTKHSWLEEQLMAGSGLKQDFKADEKKLRKGTNNLPSIISEPSVIRIY